MSHNCFISFKKEDSGYRDAIAKVLKKEQIQGKSLDRWIESDDIDYVMNVIRTEYMANTGVTIFLIGEHSSENEGFEYDSETGKYYNKQNFIIRELKATLYDGKDNRRSGLLGVVLPSMYKKVYGETVKCPHCGVTVRYVYINDSTVIKEFSENYYLKESCGGEHYGEDGRFAVLVKYDDFIKEPDKYIDAAHDKLKQKINDEVHWRDIEHVYEK